MPLLLVAGLVAVDDAVDEAGCALDVTYVIECIVLYCEEHY